MRFLQYVIVALLLILHMPLWAEEYDATVTTDSGSYTVPVEVEGGEVTTVNWPNGGNMSVSGADLDSSGSASGTNSRGDYVQIEIDGYNEAAH